MFRALARQILGLLAAACVAMPLSAQDLPKVEYSADTVMEHEAGAMQGKVYYAPGKERREMNQGGMNMVTISRHDKKVMWMLMPETKSYMEMPMGAQSAPGDISGYKMEHSEVGKDTLNGVPTTKSKLIMTGPDGGKLGGFMWSTKEGIMVKMDAISVDKGDKMRIKQELTNLKIGKQDPQLFEIPPGYQLSSMPGMPGMPGADMPSAGGERAADEDEQASADTGDAPEAQPKKQKKPGFSLDKLKDILR
jgi:hypothetical protein